MRRPMQIKHLNIWKTRAKSQQNIRWKSQIRKQRGAPEHRHNKYVHAQSRGHIRATLELDRGGQEDMDEKEPTEREAMDMDISTETCMHGVLETLLKFYVCVCVCVCA